MKATSKVIVFAILIFNSLFANSQEINSNTAVALNSFTLFPEASFTVHSNEVVLEKNLLTILEKSDNLEMNNYQNQEFHWYKVKTQDGREGYVYGDNIAVFVDSDIKELYAPYHLSKKNLAPNYTNAITWVGELVGRDTPSYGGAEYKELYMIFTNNLNRSEYIDLENIRADGENLTEILEFKDITGDGYEEVIRQTKSKSDEKEFNTKYLEIFSFQNSKMKSVLEERITIETYPSKTAPRLIKYFDIEDKFLRVSYLDYVDCEKYCCKDGLKNTTSNAKSCMEQVTYSYSWDASSTMFKIFYDKSKVAPQVVPSKEVIEIYPYPGLNQSVGKVTKNQRLKVYQQIEKYYDYGATKSIEIYFLIETQSGKKGYIKAKEVEFIELDHAVILNEYYKQPPFYSANWTPTVLFVNLKIRK